ncbi:hypothetical protein BDZ91DRAFT_220160 [Kalaharituber pfeilii]|nr:hypothetical protein BDZ91DRAFT_220160 [Kalaharituber pfeilii]
MFMGIHISHFFHPGLKFFPTATGLFLGTWCHFPHSFFFFFFFSLFPLTLLCGPWETTLFFSRFIRFFDFSDFMGKKKYMDGMALLFFFFLFFLKNTAFLVMVF